MPCSALSVRSYASCQKAASLICFSAFFEAVLGDRTSCRPPAFGAVTPSGSDMGFDFAFAGLGLSGGGIANESSSPLQFAPRSESGG